ncbi:MAG: flagellar biosynthesis protein FliQ [Candidatus Eisenbacteria bacterium]|nr:flagellar biosynthesis protein FliQ [Candidatus Eisenbacteria bacterium]MCC7142728.1 flagellar biosynthesis protein FliQ [Candidatus Eisenbacteria bacterium]
MNTTEAVTLFQQALWTALLLAAPMLGFGLVAGLIVSVFQAATQIQEMSLSFIPKVLAVVLSLVLFLPWMLNRMVLYTTDLFSRIAAVR